MVRMHVIVGAVGIPGMVVAVSMRIPLMDVGMAVVVFVPVTVGMIVFVGVDRVAVSVFVAVVMGMLVLMGMMVVVLAFHGGLLGVFGCFRE